MEQHHRQIRALLARVRARWRRRIAFQAAARASLAVSGVLTVALFLTYWTTRAPIALAAIALIALALAVGALVWGLWPAREIPSDARVARFIEETEPSLDDRLASAVDLAASPGGEGRPALAAPMVADAARRVSSIDPAAVVPGRTLRRAGFQAAAAVLLLAAIGFLGRDTAHRSFDAVSLALFPSRVALEVVPGNARIQAGSPLTIEARLLGNRAPVVAQVLRAEGAAAIAAGSGDPGVAWRTTEMATNPSGAFTLGLGAVAASFKYRVVAGTVTSPLYDVTVVRAPRVIRIDVEYLYPPRAGLAPHIEEDGGDIYAPAGTDVRLLIHTDREAATGQMALGGGKTIALTPRENNVLTGTLKVLEDDSYRIALSDREGLKNPGETEYFIRTLEDRPPEVRLLRPARDRSVTQLDEVDIEAQAEDDFGVDRLELVYAVRGGTERVAPLAIPRRSASVTGTHTLYLEDLDVQPGDFVSYYVRARDVARGRRSSETRSDIFFLDVKGFELEFRLAQSEGTMGATPNKSLDDLVTAQKQVIVATWKLDRRAQTANGAKSEQDIRSVSRAEAELKMRVEETSSSFRGSTMRDPRRGRGGVQPRRPGGTQPPPDTLKAGQTMSEEDAMTAAASAMGRAVQSLNALKTAQALAPEMEALNQLLKAQAAVKKREVSRQQAPGEGGSNRTTQDMSRMFDKELQSQQQTNYETPKSAQQPEQPDSMLDKIKDLARRQDALLKEQQELARDRDQMTAEELKRELEKLTREQSDLRQRAEEMAKQVASQQNQTGQRSSQSQSGRQPGQKPSGQPSQSGRGSTGGGDTSEQIRAASEEMRNAVSDLRRDDPRQASARGSRALEQLRELQRQLQAATPDERRRALGDMQLEARQLADAQRQVASEVGKVAPGDAGQDALRRLAGEEERLADRARRLQQGLGQQPGTDAAKVIERERIPDRMRQSAEQLRSAAALPNPSADRSLTKSVAAAQEEMARALDKVANGLSTDDQPRDGESQKLSEQLARAQALRDQIEGLTREASKLGGHDSSRSENAEGQSGQAGQSQGAGGNGGDVSRLRDEYNRRLQETRKLLDELRRDDSALAPGGMGFTFEGQGMVLSAPGTEPFKQDFAKWEALRKQVTLALDRAESSLTQRLQARQSGDRLAAGVDDKAPVDYQQQVDSYFKALATPKKP